MRWEFNGNKASLLRVQGQWELAIAFSPRMTHVGHYDVVVELGSAISKESALQNATFILKKEWPGYLSNEPYI